MKKTKTEGQDRRGTAPSKPRSNAGGQSTLKKNPLDVCDSAHDAETYRLGKDDEACDDGIK